LISTAGLQANPRRRSLVDSLRSLLAYPVVDSGSMLDELFNLLARLDGRQRRLVLGGQPARPGLF